MKIKKKRKKLKKRCHYCQRRATSLHECLTCERTDKKFVVPCCAAHHVQGLEEVKKHALVKHPVNILRATVAALKGDDVF